MQSFEYALYNNDITIINETAFSCSDKIKKMLDHIIIDECSDTPYINAILKLNDNITVINSNVTHMDMCVANQFDYVKYVANNDHFNNILTFLIFHIESHMKEYVDNGIYDDCRMLNNVNYNKFIQNMNFLVGDILSKKCNYGYAKCCYGFFELEYDLIITEFYIKIEPVQSSDIINYIKNFFNCNKKISIICHNYHIRVSDNILKLLENVI